MDKEQARNEILELRQKLNYYNEQYYLHENSVVSDREFDSLLEKLIALEKAHPEFDDPNSPSSRVGGGITKEFPTVTHRYPMLSLGNTYSAEDLADFDQRIRKTLGDEPFEYLCELKFDGVAMSLRYENGKLSAGVTRGNGTQGDDVTNNVRTIRTVPLSLSGQDFPEDFEVRGEVMLPLKEFRRINAEREDIGEAQLANPRNAASGTIKMQDSKVVASRNLDCYLYYLLGENLGVGNQAEALEKMKEWGFFVSPTYRLCANLDEVMEYIEHWREGRNELGVETDGIVIKINDFKQRERLGNTSKSPRWAIAYKYETERAYTKLKNVTYQVGRTGAVTPVANLEPVDLAGTVVKRASLYNANEIERLGLRKGDTVGVEKGGEIIPKIVDVATENRPDESKSIAFVENCPECDTKLIRKEGEAVHYCPNETGCPPQIKGKIEHFVQRQAMNIMSLGTRTINALFNKGLANNIADLYELTYDQVIELEGFKEKSVNKLLQAIEDSKKKPFETVLFAIGIRFVGKTVAEKLARHFGSIDKIEQADFETLIDVPEIGEQIANSVIEFFKNEKSKELIERLKSHGLQFEVVADDSQSPASNQLDGLSFVVSGVFANFSRDGIKDAVKAHGGKIVSAISSKVDYLLAGEKIGPSKLSKAEKLGTKIISEEDFAELISD
ncbi:DNA ligase [Fulvitalea axinellae]|uniref:DNA ligase n=1 Tax=Fulvitalea axinellae TaxID=1182444 RepID=A0AAU9CXB4_9BACT|nr:DNA ligase [Fulvitalea axinellae]